MNLKKGLELAIEGGYTEEQRCTELGILKSVEARLLDINFWNTLAKGEGWAEWQYIFNGHRTRDYAEWEKKQCNFGVAKLDRSIHRWIPTWHWKMLMFTEKLAEGKTIDEAFDLATQ